MGENELERVMSSFFEGEIDVLVCTTIIETGLDIPNVNTIIIQDADKMGLSQLYQLRGRVGRSNRLAYAYLMYKKDKVLSEISEKRLQTIREFTEFGSGFKIAMRDLEIRGAGNILGAEQHGHMDAVGYDMYCKLLAEAIEAAKSGDSVTEQKEDFETTVDIQVNAFIPPFYIENEDFKLEIYKKISHILDGTDYSDVLDEITDRFGTPPIAVINLLDVALIKTIAHKAGFCSVTQKKGGIILAYKEQPNISVIAKAAAKLKGRLLFTAGDAPYVTLKQGENVLDDLKEALPLLIG
jgi:transcription-repair coupling factor (superfamily II helicase)